MSEDHRTPAHEAAKVTRTQPHPEQAPPTHATYTYETAGITEREGHVPRWLWVVVVVLVIWGIYYLVAYWQAPAGTTVTAQHPAMPLVPETK